jgi:hypothetical protein
MSFRPESYKIVLMLFYSISRPLNHLHNTHTYQRIKTYVLCASIALQNCGAALWMGFNAIPAFDHAYRQTNVESVIYP